MTKDNEILQAVRAQDVDSLHKLLQKHKNGKSKSVELSFFVTGFLM